MFLYIAKRNPEECLRHSLTMVMIKASCLDEAQMIFDNWGAYSISGRGVQREYLKTGPTWQWNCVARIIDDGHPTKVVEYTYKQ